MRHFLAGNERVERADQPDVGQNLVENRPNGTGRHGDRQFALILADDTHHWLNGPDRLQAALEGGLFLVSNPPWIGRTSSFAHEHVAKGQRRPATQGVKPIFRKKESVVRHRFLPGLVMHRHRVGERSVTIENDGVDRCSPVWMSRVSVAGAARGPKSHCVAYQAVASRGAQQTHYALLVRQPSQQELYERAASDWAGRSRTSRSVQRCARSGGPLAPLVVWTKCVAAA